MTTRTMHAAQHTARPTSLRSLFDGVSRTRRHASTAPTARHDRSEHPAPAVSPVAERGTPAGRSASTAAPTSH